LGRAVSDNNVGSNYWLQVNRGNADRIGSVNFPNGNVGIGNVAPAYALDVTGQTRITYTGETANSALILSSPTDVSLDWEVSGNNTNLKYWSFHAKGNTFFGSAENDGGGTNDWIRVQRGPNDSLDLINFPSGPVVIGNSVLGANAGLCVYPNGPNVGIGAYGYLNSGGSGNGSGTTAPYAIMAGGRVLASEFDANSDARIKNIIGLSDNAADLQTILKLRITNYHFIDTVARGGKLYKKVIAQEVEQIYPDAISKSTDVIPDIFQMADIKNGHIAIANTLKAGDMVKLILSNRTEFVKVNDADGNGFNVNLSDEGKVFVYGRQVNDFRSVDYEALTTLNISATQQLVKMINDLQQQNSTLTRKNVETENKIASMGNDIETIKTALQLASKAH
jgi:hypothetical protein